MTLAELEEKVAELSSQRLVYRDMLAWVIACAISGTEDQETSLRELSDYQDGRIDRVVADRPDKMRLLEAMRRDKDWIVEATRRLLAGEEG